MLLEGKLGLVLGIANKRSIAWGIAQSVAREGARLAVTYQGERLEENVRELAAGLKDPLILPCDVAKDADLVTLAQAVKREFGSLDFVVHGVAYALREELDGEFLNTSREGYRVAQDISSYSLTALARAVAPLMEGRAGSIVTLTYLGGERVVPHYNVMGVAKAALDMSTRYLASELGPKGIRVNAISAGPVRTLAARSISGIDMPTVRFMSAAVVVLCCRSGIGRSETSRSRLPCAKITISSTVFRSSRTLPGHSYCIRRSTTPRVTPVTFRSCSRLNSLMKASMSTGMSSRRSRSGGTSRRRTRRR